LSTALKEKDDTSSMNDNIHEASVQIKNKRGLHARASAKFANLANEYNSDVTVEKDGVQVAGNSIMGLMMLAASKGSFITIKTNGEDAKDTLNSLVSLVEKKFDED
jgi:phosphocarrier protein